MHPGVLTCPPETPIWTVARMMDSYSVHAIVVTGLDAEGESERPWGVVSGRDLARAAAEGVEEATAGGIASTEVVTAAQDDPLRRVAQLMTEHEVEHVIVVDDSDRPLGVVSTRDIAAAVSRR